MNVILQENGTTLTMLYHGFPLLSYRQRKYIILRHHVSIRNTAWFPKAFDEVVFNRTE